METWGQGKSYAFEGDVGRQGLQLAPQALGLSLQSHPRVLCLLDHGGGGLKMKCSRAPVSEGLSRVTTLPELGPGIAQEAVQRPPGTRCLLQRPPHRSEAQP